MKLSNYGVSCVSLTVKDGLSLIDTAFDGVQRPSTFAQVGQRFGGDTGATIGDMVNLGLGVKGLADAGGRKIGQSAFSAELANTILSTILPDSLLPCQQ